MATEEDDMQIAVTSPQSSQARTLGPNAMLFSATAVRARRAGVSRVPVLRLPEASQRSNS